MNALTPVICPHCDVETEVREGSYRYVVSEMDMTLDHDRDGIADQFDAIGEYDVTWENGYELDRMYFYNCCGEEIEDDVLLAKLYGDLGERDKTFERITCTRILAEIAGRTHEDLAADVTAIGEIVNRFEYDPDPVGEEDMQTLMSACSRIFYAFTHTDASATV